VVARCLAAAPIAGTAAPPINAPAGPPIAAPAAPPNPAPTPVGIGLVGAYLPNLL